MTDFLIYMRIYYPLQLWDDNKEVYEIPKIIRFYQKKLMSQETLQSITIKKCYILFDAKKYFLSDVF